MEKIKKYKYSLAILLMLFSMILLGNNSLMSLVVAEHDKPLYALNKLINESSYKVDGTLISGETGVSELLDTSINLNFNGMVNEGDKYMEVYFGSNLYNNNEAFIEYYENNSRYLIMTPIEQIEKLVINKGDSERIKDNNLQTIVDKYLSDATIIKNQVISVESGTYTTINLRTDCYDYKFTKEEVYNMALLLSNEEKASLIKEMIESAEGKMYIDNNLHIRKIEVCFKLTNNKKLELIASIDGYNNKYMINQPDDSDAIDLLNLNENQISDILNEITSSNN